MVAIGAPSSTKTRLDEMTADQVVLTGGTIDGISIGATTASTGAFSTITASSTANITGAATIGGAASITGAATLAAASTSAGLTDSVGLKCTANVGTVGTGVTAVEYGDGADHTTVLTVNTVLPNIAGGASLGVGNLLYTFPAGAVVVNVSYISMAITQTTGHINANTPVVGLGTVIASGAVSVLSGTATFQNILTGQTAANCTGTPTVMALIPTAAAPFVMLAAAAHTLYFNSAAAWAASGDPAAILAGTVVVQWTFLH